MKRLIECNQRSRCCFAQKYSASHRRIKTESIVFVSTFCTVTFSHPFNRRRRLSMVFSREHSTSFCVLFRQDANLSRTITNRSCFRATMGRLFINVGEEGSPVGIPLW